MIHCVTQQQPKDLNPLSINIIENVDNVKVIVYPNPTKDCLTIELDLKLSTNIGFEVYNINGKKVKAVKENKFNKGNNITEINTSDLSSGLYTVSIMVNNKSQYQKK